MQAKYALLQCSPLSLCSSHAQTATLSQSQRKEAGLTLPNAGSEMLNCTPAEKVVRAPLAPFEMPPDCLMTSVATTSSPSSPSI